ncbi:predicted protein, partial [Mycobacterium tuberculosis T85]
MREMREMSYMIAVPDMLSSAAGDLASIGSSINASTRAAAAATTRLLPAAADEVSAHIAALFSGHGEGYQAIARQMAAFHDQFTLALTSSAGAYASAEATNVEQQVLGLINAPTQALLGRPLYRQRRRWDRGQSQRWRRWVVVWQRRQRVFPNHRRAHRGYRRVGRVDRQRRQRRGRRSRRQRRRGRQRRLALRQRRQWRRRRGRPAGAVVAPGVVDLLNVTWPNCISFYLFLLLFVTFPILISLIIRRFYVF